MAYSRVGELEKAEGYLLNILDLAPQRKCDWFAAACSNLSVLSIQLNRRKELVIKYAREGLDIASKVYSRESPEVSSTL